MGVASFGRNVGSRCGVQLKNRRNWLPLDFNDVWLNEETVQSFVEVSCTLNNFCCLKLWKYVVEKSL